MPTDWVDVLIPNALLRTYEGFGGFGKTLSQAIGDGDLMVTGTWLIDQVALGVDGLITITCRDMGKLLIEQQMYLPLMPPGKYPLAYSRWRYEGFFYPAVNAYDRVDPDAFSVQFGPGAEGRKYITDVAFDSDSQGYGILGTDGGVFCYNTTFFGSRGAGSVGSIAGIAATPSGDGVWVANVGGDVWALGAAANLGGITDSLGVAVSLVAIEPTHTGAGYWLLNTDGTVWPVGDAQDWTGGANPPTSVFIADMARTANSGGFWVLAEDGTVYAYGNAGWVANPSLPSGHSATGIAGTPSGGGYYVVSDFGEVYAYGDAVHRGNAPGGLNKPIIDIVVTPTNGGYWLVATDGGIFSFGDAVFYGSMGNTMFAAKGMARTADAHGYWLVADGGVVEHFGDAADYGNAVGGVDNAPMVGFDMDPLGRGYWSASADGSVFAFGEAVYYGGYPVDPNGAGQIWRLVAHPSGRGYWLMGKDGGVFNRGNAGFFGSGSGIMDAPAVDMAATPSGNGYWLLSEHGSIYSFGDAVSHYYGNAPITSPDKAAGMAARYQGDGYWIVSQNGAIFALGAAKYQASNGDYAAAITALNDPIIGMDATSDGEGYVVVAGDGGVFSFGTAPFEGSLPLDYSGTKRYDGNYFDFTDIIKDLLLWSGWLLHGTNEVYGSLESTGTFADDAFPPDTFDKKPIIDGIKAIKDIVGFHFWIDEEGSARFESPNWYVYGNFVQETGGRTGQIPEIDERLLLTGYSLSYVDTPVRSELIITSDDPTLAADTTITTRLDLARKNPDGSFVNELIAQLLRGMVRPAMLPVPLNVTKAQQEDMTVLVETFMTFQLLQGQVNCIAHPAIQINDQVRIFEEITGETDVHYIRGISSTHDLDTGVWTYQLTTNRVGPGRTAFITGGGTNRARDLHRVS
jgi:hypothetical protein